MRRAAVLPLTEATRAQRLTARLIATSAFVSLQRAAPCAPLH